MKRAPLKETAARIAAHLKRFEADPTINARDRKYGLQPYWNTHSFSRGSRVFVVYISYQGPSSLTRDQAEAYLAWLDAGHVGTHWMAEREGK